MVLREWLWFYIRAEMSKLPSDMKTYHLSFLALFFVHYLFQILEANFFPLWPFQQIAGTRSQIPLGQTLSWLTSYPSVKSSGSQPF